MTEQQPNRQSIRKKGWDYATPGRYFVTMNTHGNASLFGAVVYGRMVLNDRGRVAEQCWLEIPAHFPEAEPEDLVVMPNHVHGVLHLKGRTGGPWPARTLGDAGLRLGKPMIRVQPWGLAADHPPAEREALATGRLLLISPFDDAIATPSAQRAAWCNQYVLAHSTRLLIGHLTPGRKSTGCWRSPGRHSSTRLPPRW